MFRLHNILHRTVTTANIIIIIIIIIIILIIHTNDIHDD
jgi:hypothetical protein